jgi:hypothetical protein
MKSKYWQATPLSLISCQMEARHDNSMAFQHISQVLMKSGINIEMHFSPFCHLMGLCCCCFENIEV